MAAPYNHKSNRFWRLVEESGLVSEDLAKPEHFSKLPAAVGVGFADQVGVMRLNLPRVRGYICASKWLVVC